jgi:hypothetical protein
MAKDEKTRQGYNPTTMKKYKAPRNNWAINREKISQGAPVANNVKEGGLLKKWFTDDKGIFQGGMKKRAFGRIRDRFEDSPLRKGGTKEYDAIHPDNDSLSKNVKAKISEDIREAQSLNEKAGYDMYTRNQQVNPEFRDSWYDVPAYSEEFSYAREFALDFNPSDHEQVKEMQRRLNNAGYLGDDSKELVVDGILGKNTLNALRSMQSDMIYEKQYAQTVLSEQLKRNNELDSIQLINKSIKEDQKRRTLYEGKNRPYPDKIPD